MKRVLFIGFLSSLFLISSVFSFAAERDPQAESFIQEKIDYALSILGNDTLDLDTKKEKFRKFINETADVKRIAYFVLGRYRRTATPEELKRFTHLFYEYASAVYESELNNYHGETMHVLGSQSLRPGDIIVFAEITSKKRITPLPIKWRVLNRKHGYKVVDVEALGIWLAQSQRDQFTSVISRNQGQIQAAIDVLNTKLNTLKDNPKNP